MAKACSKHRASDSIVARLSNRKPHLCGAPLSAGRRGVRNARPWGAASRRHLVLLCHGQQIQALLVHRRVRGPIDRVPVLLGTRLQLSPIVHVALQLRKLRGEVAALRVRLVLGLGGSALQHLTEDGIQIVPLLQRGRPLTGHHVRWVMRGTKQGTANVRCSMPPPIDWVAMGAAQSARTGPPCQRPRAIIVSSTRRVHARRGGGGGQRLGQSFRRLDMGSHIN